MILNWQTKKATKKNTVDKNLITLDSFDSEDMPVKRKRIDNSKSSFCGAANEDHSMNQKYMKQPWYTINNKEYAKYESIFNDYSVNFKDMYESVVKRQLYLQCFMKTKWRKYPCKNIATVLPPNFKSWKQFLENGGVYDTSTGSSSLHEHEKLQFWNDQCLCKCIHQVELKPEKTETIQVISIENRILQIQKLLENDCIPNQRIQILNNTLKILKKKKSISKIQRLSSIEESRKTIEENEIEISKRVIQFWSTLLEEYIQNTKDYNLNKDGQFFIDWYWNANASRKEFLEFSKKI